MYSIKDNLLYKDNVQVPFIESPNQAGGISPKYIIEHYTADINKGQAVSWLKNKESGVSAHLVIEMDGTVVQMVKFNKRAFHAGKSTWDDIDGLNSFSIGIEIVNPGRVAKRGDKFFVGTKEIPKESVIQAQHKNGSPIAYWHTYNEAQMKAVEEVTKVLTLHYNIKEVLGHDDVSPGRKEDPGPAFDMDRVRVQPSNKEVAALTENVNFRVGGGTEFKVTEVIPKGKRVTVLVKGNTWTKIDFENKLGWVSSKYLNYF